MRSYFYLIDMRVFRSSPPFFFGLLFDPHAHAYNPFNSQRYTLMAEDAVESAGAKAPAITISIQPFIAGLEVLCHQTIDVGHSVEFYRMAILYASYFLTPPRAVSLGWGRCRILMMWLDLGIISGTEIAKDERGVFWQIPETSLARAAAIAGDEAKSRKAHADFSAIWKDADVGLPITSLKELL